MKYDFTSIIDRHGMDSIAVDPPERSPYRAGFTLREGFDHIPMWVADMNFAAPPTIPTAIIQRTQHPTYGYFLPRDEYYDSILRWQETRNGVQDLRREHIGYENGVLGGVSSALRALCT
ncbi:MAG: aspartate aminotransferase, partial [Oscillospiraceae bacterium]|nr:aspartate aminotransferase [Oscillospiraceae bacterium]